MDASSLLASVERELGAHMESLHDRATFIAPALIAYEAGNVVHTKKPEAFAGSADARAQILRALLSDIVVIPYDADAQARTGLLAESERLSFYDASYLDLALSRGAALLTEDDRLAKAASRRLKKSFVLRLP